MKQHNSFYIFLIWEKARSKQNFFFEELQKKFVIKDVYEILWSEKNFSNNLRRFYGPGKLGNANKKTRLCGTGPFLLIIISDPKPKFEKRRTSKGMELVNVNLFDNKKIYRKLTGAGFAIHSSITEKETNDDITMLLGKNLKDLIQDLPENWNGSFKRLESDLVGQNGWKDLNQIFYVLNSTINYVVLRNFENLSNNLSNYQHNDIDVITDDVLRIPYLTNGGKAAFNEKFPPFVLIGNKSISFDFGYPEDGYFDEKWLKDILKRRILCQGVFVPSKLDHFYSLFYHAVFHQKKISEEYKKKLYSLSRELGINQLTESTFDNLNNSKEFLENYMNKAGYRHPNSTQYKISHNKVFRLVKVSIWLWKTQGIRFFVTALKGKLKRTLSK